MDKIKSIQPEQPIGVSLPENYQRKDNYIASLGNSKADQWK